MDNVFIIETPGPLPELGFGYSGDLIDHEAALFPQSVTFGIKVGKYCRALKPRLGALRRFTFTPTVHLNLQAAVLNRHQQRSPELPGIQGAAKPVSTAVHGRLLLSVGSPRAEGSLFGVIRDEEMNFRCSIKLL